ncbi:MAG: Xaa-Pro dipeptidase [archaeon GW2011_AR10]|nr:MAG: Xaa-Pro dipeptidase [archaeon GW2011_AR10]KKR36713.1 MAG: Xaa-Pro dipeptidase [Parcubacteria group bacterium GW2011_GWF2_40_10]
MPQNTKLENIKRACGIADLVFAETVRVLRKRAFSTELAVAGFIKQRLASYGAKPAFRTIVGSGSWSSVPHCFARNKPLEKGFCIIDFGAKFNGYCSDLTRTVYFGKPSKKERALYQKVLSVQGTAIKSIRPELSGAEARSIAERALGRHAKFFPHGLGHGLGKYIHTKPFLKKGKKGKNKLREGQIITVEPGIYFVGKFGIRIEDDCLITGNGARQLTHSTKRLLVFSQQK